MVIIVDALAVIVIVSTLMYVDVNVVESVFVVVEAEAVVVMVIKSET